MQKSQSEGSLAFLKDSKAPCELIPRTRKNKCTESASLIFFAYSSSSSNDDENSATYSSYQKPVFGHGCASNGKFAQVAPTGVNVVPITVFVNKPPKGNL